MTSFGIYDRQNLTMLNIELARILQADREREIKVTIRNRQLLRSADTTDATPAASRSMRPAQRPASTGALSR